MAERGEDMIMLGGGNPSRVPAGRSLPARADDDGQCCCHGDAFERLVGNYAAAGRRQCRFARAVAGLLRRECGWPIDRGQHRPDQWQPDGVLLFI
jgi:alanine-alpha-ketoisovalerate/valine-pyruvate aminotransferase